MPSSMPNSNAFWMPFTQMATSSAPLKVIRGQGVRLELESGAELIDCISSWWVTLHGHCREEISRAIGEQAGRLEQVIAAGYTHQPAQDLLARLQDKAPAGLCKAFFSDNGSTAVEVAMKMAFQYWRNLGDQKRTRFLALEGGYHGDTIGALSLGDHGLFSDMFEPLCFAVDRVPFPQTWMEDDEVEAKEKAALDALDRLLEKDGDSYAAMIMEPLVQGASGMRMARPEFYAGVEQRLKRAGVLLIFDEVMTGFYRTGTWFATEQILAKPDFLCLSKGITGGFLPLGLTLTTNKVFDAFLSSTSERTFYHGHSYTASPIACAAANASWQILEKEKDRPGRINQWHHKAMEKLKGHPRLEHFRVQGTIAAMSLKDSSQAWKINQVDQFKAAFIKAGFLIRPLGSEIYLIPPYCIEEDELLGAYEAIGAIAAQRA